MESSPRSPPNKEIFLLTDPLILKETYSNVGDPLEFVEKVQSMHERAKRSALDTDDLTKTALYKGLVSVCLQEEDNFRPFCEGLVESACEVLQHDIQSDDDNVMSGTWTLSRRACRGYIANAVLGNVIIDPVDKPLENKGGLHFARMFENQRSVAADKTICLLQYLLSTTTLEDHDNTISILRFDISRDDFVALPQWNRPIQANTVHEIVTNPMETEKAGAMVNFANQVYGYGRFLPNSCTQEEILQVCCPEINVGMLFYGRMKENEAYVVRNAQRFSAYQGYGGSFRFAGPVAAGFPAQSIIFMDASITRKPIGQFQRETIMRDIQKAYVGFRGAALVGTTPGKIKISTGKWGCGAFGGDPALKFLEQVLAASLVGDNVSLIFSSYRDAGLCQSLKRIHASCVGLPPKVVAEEVLSKPELFGGDGSYSGLMKVLEGLCD